MNLPTIKNTPAAIIACALIMSLTSCVKDNFTLPSPGANIDPPGIKANMTIAQFKQLYYVPVLGQTLPVPIADSTIILSGIINADDRSGNFYKTLSLQDSTGGIQLKIESSYLYQTYPIGRRIWIKTKGLYIFDYGGTAQIGGFIDLSGTHPAVGGILANNAAQSVITGQWGLPVTPKVITIAALENVGNYVNLQSVLYEIDSVEFAASDTVPGFTFGNELSKASGSVGLNDCNGYGMIVYSSGYANFANARPSGKHGTILGIYNYYSYASTGNFELELRDSTDIRFTSNQRCQ